MGFFWGGGGLSPYHVFNRKDRNQENSVHTKHPIWPICIVLVGWTCHAMQRRNLFQGYFMNNIILIVYLTYFLTWLRKNTLKEHTSDGEEMHFTEEKKAEHIELAAAWPAAEGNCQSSPLPCDVIMSVVLLLGLSVRANSQNLCSDPCCLLSPPPFSASGFTIPDGSWDLYGILIDFVVKANFIL